MIVATRGVAEHTDPCRDQLLGRLVGIGAVHVRTAREIGLCYGSCLGIDIHCEDLQARSSERHGVGANPTAEVDHLANARLEEPARVVVSDLWSCRLLQTGSGEEHLGRSLTKLGFCLTAQRGLGERSGRKLRTELRARPRGRC
jgi:hypothetical protein